MEKQLTRSYSSDEVFARIKNEDIRFIDLQFTGLTGRFHHTTISANTFTQDQMEDGLPKLDGSSIVGFASIEDSDLILKPDPTTFAIIPWSSNRNTARLLCDVFGVEEGEGLNLILGEFPKMRKSILSKKDLTIVSGDLR